MKALELPASCNCGFSLVGSFQAEAGWSSVRGDAAFACAVLTSTVHSNSSSVILMRDGLKVRWSSQEELLSIGITVSNQILQVFVPAFPARE